MSVRLSVTAFSRWRERGKNGRGRTLGGKPCPLPLKQKKKFLNLLPREFVTRLRLEVEISLVGNGERHRRPTGGQERQ